MQSAAAVALMQLLIFFAADIAAMTRNVFNGPDNPQKLPFPLGVSGPSSSTWFLGPTHLSWFSRLCTAHKCD